MSAQPPGEGRAGEPRRATTSAEFAAATAEYEAALMSGDEAWIASADERLTAADRAYGAELSERVQRQKVRASLPTFAEMLAHPWSQLPEVVATPMRVVSPEVASDAAFPHPAPSDTAGCCGCAICQEPGDA